MNGPAFIAVLPAEVERYGAAAAIMLALIRYRTGTDGPGRIEREGYRWWRVTHRDLAEATGLSTKAVRTALKALDGVVLANHFPPLANQSLAYRVVADDDALTCQLPAGAPADLPVAQAGIPGAPAGTDRAPNGTPPCPSGHLHLYMETLEKGGEHSRNDAQPTAASGDTPPANSEPATPEPNPPRDDPHEDESTSAVGDAAAATAAPSRVATLPLPLSHWPQDYPEPEPPERCPAHADWDSDRDGRVPKCGACADRREAHGMRRGRSGAQNVAKLSERGSPRATTATTATRAGSRTRGTSCQRRCVVRTPRSGGRGGGTTFDGHAASSISAVPWPKQSVVRDANGSTPPSDGRRRET